MELYFKLFALVQWRAQAQPTPTIRIVQPQDRFRLDGGGVVCAPSTILQLHLGSDRPHGVCAQWFAVLYFAQGGVPGVFQHVWAHWAVHYDIIGYHMTMISWLWYHSSWYYLAYDLWYHWSVFNPLRRRLAQPPCRRHSSSLHDAQAVNIIPVISGTLHYPGPWPAFAGQPCLSCIYIPITWRSNWIITTMCI